MSVSHKFQSDVKSFMFTWYFQCGGVYSCTAFYGRWDT